VVVLKKKEQVLRDGHLVDEENVVRAELDKFLDECSNSGNATREEGVVEGYGNAVWRNPKNVCVVKVEFPPMEGRKKKLCMCVKTEKALSEFDVWVFAMTQTQLEVSSQAMGLRKVIKPERVEELLKKQYADRGAQALEELTSTYVWPKPGAQRAKQSCIYRAWQPFTLDSIDDFETHTDRMHQKNASASASKTQTDVKEHLLKEPKDRGFFSPSEITEVLFGYICHAYAKKPQGEPVYPIFLAAQELDMIDCMFPLVYKEEDIKERRLSLKNWKATRFYEAPPLYEIKDHFGPNQALYYYFCNQHAKGLAVPAFMVMCSYGFHYYLSVHGSSIGLMYGAAFNEGWSQCGFSLGLCLWSCLYLTWWQRAMHEAMYKLGRDEVTPNPPSLQNARQFLRAHGILKVSKLKKERNTEYVKPRRMSNFVELSRHALMGISLLLMIAFSVGVIALLCYISDKFYLNDWTQYGIPVYLDSLIKNLASVAVYFGVSIPLEMFYNWLTEAMTMLEQHRDLDNHVERLISRRALFQLMNYLGWFIYLAFARPETGKNILDLRQQLGMFFTLKPSGLLSSFWSYYQVYAAKEKLKKELPDGEDLLGRHHVSLAHFIQDEYSKEPCELYDDWLQICVIFATAICFAPIFPTGLLLAFIHTIFEYVGDKVKLVHVQRMPLPRPGDHFAMRGWITVFSGVHWLSILMSMWLVFVFLKTLGKEAVKDGCIGPA
jgi:hypothetical protein